MRPPVCDAVNEDQIVGSKEDLLTSLPATLCGVGRRVVDNEVRGKERYCVVLCLLGASNVGPRP